MIAVLTAAVLGLAVATPAQASPDQCVSGWFCVYENASSPFGRVDGRSGNVRRNTCIPLTRSNGSYFWNRTGTRWYLFRTTRCDGRHIEVPPGAQGSVYVFAPDPSWNDAVVAVIRTSQRN